MGLNPQTRKRTRAQNVAPRVPAIPLAVRFRCQHPECLEHSFSRPISAGTKAAFETVVDARPGNAGVSAPLQPLEKAIVVLVRQGRSLEGV